LTDVASPWAAIDRRRVESVRGPWFFVLAAKAA
jgi:hypothetical protein